MQCCYRQGTTLSAPSWTLPASPTLIVAGPPVTRSAAEDCSTAARACPDFGRAGLSIGAYRLSSITGECMSAVRPSRACLTVLTTCACVAYMRRRRGRPESWRLPIDEDPDDAPSWTGSCSPEQMVLVRSSSAGGTAKAEGVKSARGAAHCGNLDRLGSHPVWAGPPEVNVRSRRQTLVQEVQRLKK